MNSSPLLTYVREKIKSTEGNLLDFCRTHLHLFEKEGLVTDGEFYKFTPMAKHLEQLDFNAPPSPLAAASGQDVLFINGKLQGDLPQIPGLTFHRLADKLPQLGSAFKSPNALSYLHHSLLQDGLVIEVAKSTKIHSPLHIVHQYNQGISAPFIFIHAQAHSCLTVLEESMGAGSSGLITENYFKLESGASIDHIQLDRGDEATLQHGSTLAEVGADANYKNYIFHVSGKLNRRNLKLKMQHPGANGESYNLYLTSGTEHSDIHTVLEHQAPDTTSQQLAKGILDQESRGVFTGRIHIHQHAQRVAAGQLNKNLILSKKAQANSQPQLEIFADDVKCSHGSSTGQLSPEELFYFKARGIPERRARILLAHGFGLEVVLKIADPLAREWVSQIIMENLKAKFNLGGAQ